MHLAASIVLTRWQRESPLPSSPSKNEALLSTVHTPLMLLTLLLLPATSAQLGPSLRQPSPSPTAPAASTSPDPASPTTSPPSSATTVYETAPLAWLALPTLRECATVRLRWAGGLPPFSVRVTAKSEPRVVLTNVTEREAPWLCAYREGLWLGFGVAGRDGVWAMAEMEEPVERGPAGCAVHDPPEPFDGTLAGIDENAGGGDDEDATENTGAGMDGQTSYSASPTLDTAATKTPDPSLASVAATPTPFRAPASAPSFTSSEGSISPSNLPVPPDFASATAPDAALGAVTEAATDTSSSHPVSRAVLAGLAAAIAGLIVVTLVAWLLIRRLRRKASSPLSDGGSGKSRRAPPAPLNLASGASATSVPRGATSPEGASLPRQPRPTRSPAMKAITSPFALLLPRNPHRATPFKQRRAPSAPLSAQAEPEPEFVRTFTPMTPFPLELRQPLAPGSPCVQHSKPRALVPTPYPRSRGRLDNRAPYRPDTDDEDSIFASPSETAPSVGRRDVSLISCAGTPPPYEVACALTPGDFGRQHGETL